MEWVSRKVCAWFHGGGDITRDPSGRINWQCRKCGRWSDPVSAESERQMIERHIEAALKEKNHD